jgi:hypothetical protein
VQRFVIGRQHTIVATCSKSRCVAQCNHEGTCCEMPSTNRDVPRSYSCLLHQSW